MAKTNDTTDLTPILYLGTFAIAYFGIIKPITNKLGITKSADDVQVENENKQASATNKWSATYYKTATGIRFTDAYVTKLAKQIHDAWGYFNDDETAIYGVFRNLSNLIELSQLCGKYVDLYGDDLYSRLTNAWYKWDDGLSPEEFNVIAKIVNALPAK